MRLFSIVSPALRFSVMASLHSAHLHSLASSGKVSSQLLFWAFHVLTGIVVCAARQCPPCGNQTVPYPLSTSNDCGHPHYGLSCTPQRSQLQLQAISGSYSVRKVIPASRVLTVVPAPLLSHGASCISEDLFRGGLILNQSQPFSITPANSLFLFNCSQMMLGSPFNCSANNLCHEAVMAAANSPCKPLLCCMLDNVSTIHPFGYSLNELGCAAYTSVVGLDGSLPGSRWNYEVQLQWDTPKELPCAEQSQCPLNSVCRTEGTPRFGICQCNSGYNWSPPDGLCKKGFLLRHRTALIGSLIPSLLVFSAILSLVGTALYKYQQAKRHAKEMLLKERSLFLNSNGGSATLFTAKEMRLATYNYHKDRLLGKGGFGEVYKGVLRNGSTVAIKVARLGNVMGSDQVLNEVRILSQVNHRNLVRLLGCCIDAEQPLMVYEFVSNGTLLDHLSQSRSPKDTKQSYLTWNRRLRIAKETAEGLSYLHSFAYPPIIHRDVKSSNILLDANLTAKVSDFGLSRLMEDDVTHISTCAQGTFGYLDPHYYRNYQLSAKSDVYSFGVVLLELVTSQRALDFTRGPDDVSLAAYVCSKYAEGFLDEVLDPILVQSASESEMASMRDLIVLGMRCSDEDCAKRPLMPEVAHQIDVMLRELESY